MAWMDLNLPTDEQAITVGILSRFVDAMPGWVPTEGAPEVAIAEEFGHQIAIVNQGAIDAARFAAAGVATAFGFHPVDGVAATLPAVTLVAQLPASAGIEPFVTAVTVPAGFTISFEQRAFIVPAQVTVAVSFTEVPSGAYEGYWRGTLSIDFTALEVGASSNVGESGQVAVLQTVSPVIVSATLTEQATGGTDPESMTTFLGRFTAWLQTLKPGGVRAQNIADFATTVAGVQRAIAVDRYNPLTPDVPAERTVTVIPVDAAGAIISPDVEARLLDALEQIREVGFIFHIAEPSYAAPAIVVNVTKGTDHTVSEVQANVAAVVTGALHPSRWGTIDGDLRSWTERGTLRVLDVALLASSATGVADVLSVTINGTAADLVLADGDPGALIDLFDGGGSTLTVNVS